VLSNSTNINPAVTRSPTAAFAFVTLPPVTNAKCASCAGTTTADAMMSPLFVDICSGCVLLFPVFNTMVGMASGVDDDPHADNTNAKRVMAIEYIFFILLLLLSVHLFVFRDQAVLQ
jgi:hypothetical protein